VRFKKRLWFLLAAAAPSICSAATKGSHQLERDDQSASEKELARVIAIEQDFAAASLSQGIKQSFLAYAAPDAVLFRPKPVAAVTALINDPDDNDGLTLDWWPAMGAIARSGDMALSVGPWVLEVPGATRQRLYGYYATIWKKQPDGSWKFVIDGAGAKIASEPAREKGGAVAILPVSQARRPVGSTAALHEVRVLEGSVGQAAMRDARRAIGSRLASDAWVIGSSAEPDGTPNGWRSEIMRRPKKLRFQYLKGDASSGADFAYTYGLVESLDPSIPLHNATYLHVWQRRKGEWRLIFQGIKHGAPQ
jgi:ketosteroid isomerase-like protein